jgi:hypothetical protein
MRTIAATLLLVFVCGLLTAPTAAAAPPGLTAAVVGGAKLLPGGEARVRLLVRCPAGARVVEAFVYVVQDGFTSPFAFLPVRCEGRPRLYTARVRPPEERPFAPGEARVSGYVLVEDPLTGMTTDTSPTRVVRLR